MLTRMLVAATALAILHCATAAPAAARISDKMEFGTLSNGVRYFIVPRPAAPVFTGMVFVDAGSAEERTNETGIAHLLEHMAFKGTPWVGTRDWEKERPLLARIEEVGTSLTLERQRPAPDKARVDELAGQLADLHKQAARLVIPNEYDNLVTREGGQEINASTSADWTNYYMTLPSNRLEFWALLESQRLLHPAWREFYLERDVVAEERRMSIEDSPDGRMYEEFLAASFKAHPYRTPIIGWMSDIQSLTIRRVSDFYRRWYVPGNMVVLLVGDVDRDRALPVLEKYFGTIEPRPAPPRVNTVEPPQSGEKRVRVRLDAEPQLWIGWHKPTFPDEDMYVFEVIQFLLSDVGRSSRLYERLIKADHICQSADSFTAPGDKYPNLFCLRLVPRAPHTAAEAEAAALAEIERLKNEPVAAAELDKVRNQIDAHMIMSVESNLGLARRLGAYYLASGDPRILDTMRDRMSAVTPQDIQRVAQKYFTPENRTVVELVSTRGEEPSGEGRTTAGGAE